MRFQKKDPWKKEWDNLLKKEEKFNNKRKEGPTSILFQKLDRLIPKKLSDTLDAAFYKGFGLVFDKGTKVIEKTYNKERMEADYKVNQFAHELSGTKRTAKTFTKRARGTKTLNLILSFIEGVGLGLLGMAIVDIPLFIGMVMKSVYEVAISYGYEYESNEEKVFILKLIEVAMKDDEEFIDGDMEVNSAIEYISSHGDEILGWEISKEEQMRSTSDSLVKEMLYTKFIQKVPVIGVIGGLFDPAYVNRISNYAELKYRRRFISSRLLEESKEE